MSGAEFVDDRTGLRLRFGPAHTEIVGRRVEEVRPALDAVQRAVASGCWAYGMVAYEAAAGLDPTLPRLDPPEGLPLVWFGLTDRPEPDTPPPPASFTLEPWTIDWSPAEHAERVERVRAAIAAGETYQVNLTTRLRSRLSGDPRGLFHDLAQRQRGGYQAMLDLGRWAVLSASPEGFVTLKGDVITSVPMKGTAPRGATPEADAANREALVTSEKERAENVMIVDLVRNDLGKIARPGTVTVRDLLACEPYPTVWQLTSTVTARTRVGATLADVFAALFPAGSVTGAPKPRTMRLIAELETAPRGVYCGTVGYLRPGPRPSGRFGVAIRTVVVDRRDGSATYGVGGGITWSSTAAGEYAELLAKTRVLDAAGTLELIETFAVAHGAARHLAAHLNRLERSATELAFAFDRASIEAAVITCVAELDDHMLVRLRLRPDGTHALEPRPAGDPADPVRLAIEELPVDPCSPYVRHKTSHRVIFDAAQDRHPDADDVVLINPHGMITETTTANIAVLLDGQWCTPPLTDGCLPGVGRRLLLEGGELVERSIRVVDLDRADAIELISSARGRRRAVLMGGGQPPQASARIGTPRSTSRSMSVESE